MLAEVRNYGRARAFPTCIGNIFVPGAGQTIHMDNEEAIKEIEKYPMIAIRILEGGTKSDEPEVPKIDYSVYPIYELKSIAASAGIKGFFVMTKAELIKKLEDKNGTATN